MDFLKELDIVNFIASLGTSVVSEKLGGSPNDWKVKEIGDGNLNFIYLVQGTKESVIIKTAPPFIRCIGESWPLTPSRIYFEYLALQVESKFAPQHVPAIYHFDEQRHVIIMQYLQPHIILRKGLIQGIIYPELAGHLSTFLAQTLFKTSGLAMKTPEKNKLLSQFANNYDLCVVTEQVIFTEPFVQAKNNRWNSPYLDEAVQKIQEDSELKMKMSILKSKFQQHTEALIHADFHTGSIMVTETSTMAIDPEFAFFGPMAFDTGLLFANLFLAYFSQDGYGERNNYKQWILQMIQDTWNTFEFKFVELWNKEHTGDLFSPSFFNTAKDLEKTQQHFLLRLLQDTLSFAAAEMIRRIVGVAHVEDLECIQDVVVRAQCEKKALMFARELAVNSEGCLSFSNICSYATQFLPNQSQTADWLISFVHQERDHTHHITPMQNDASVSDWRRINKSTKKEQQETLTYTIFGKEIAIFQKEVQDINTVGTILWDGGIVLAKYLEKTHRENPKILEQKRFLELGSGTGLLGITVGLLGYQITCTDCECFDVLNKNIQYNVPEPLINNISVKHLTWGLPLPKDIDFNQFDIILASDLIYYNFLISPLVSTLADICRTIKSSTNKTVPVWMTTQHHNNYCIQNFKKEASVHFDFADIPSLELDPQYQADDILVWQLTLKENSSASS